MNDFFNGKNCFKGLQEAVDAVLEEGCESSDEICLSVIPFELDELTDCEDIDDNELYENEMPHDVPGTIEIEFRGENEIEEDEAEIGPSVDKPSLEPTENLNDKYFSGKSVPKYFYISKTNSIPLRFAPK